MSDFQFNVDLLRSQVARALCENPEQLVWVLAEIAADADLEEMQEHFHNMDHQTSEVADFYRLFADLLGTEGAEDEQR